MDTFARFAQPWLDRAGRIGADPRDSDELRMRKALLVLVSVLILPISLVWGAIYLALGATAGLIAWLYLVVSVGAIVMFSRTRDTKRLLRIELLDVLLAPTVSMAFLGGFIASGSVGLWGILAPLGALVFDGARAGVRWFLAFVALFLVSGLAGEFAGGGRSTLPTWFESTMIALNVTVAGAVVFGLLAEFVRQREVALAAMRVEQDRAENLLLNILPRSIADKLKADGAGIADQFAAASILFADVVAFTPLSERLKPAEVVGILDHLFTHFDLLAERYGVEKIKTIGDCYMVAAGVPTPRAEQPRSWP
jgi:guanylate cyclase